MRRLLLLGVLTAIATGVFSAPAMADGNSLGPPGGTIYAFDEAFLVIADANVASGHQADGPLYNFRTARVAYQSPRRRPATPATTAAAGRLWTRHGSPSQLTNADDVVATASALVDTGVPASCARSSRARRPFRQERGGSAPLLTRRQQSEHLPGIMPSSAI